MSDAEIAYLLVITRLPTSYRIRSRFLDCVAAQSRHSGWRLPILIRAHEILLSIALCFALPALQSPRLFAACKAISKATLLM
jgi:hypothetical protein